MTNPLEVAARELQSFDDVAAIEYETIAAAVVRVYLSAKVEEMTDAVMSDYARIIADGQRLRVRKDVLLSALLPVVSEDGGANQ